MENINLNLEVKYENDDEYQECLKKVYNIKDEIDNDDDMFTYMSNRIVILKDKMKHLEKVVNLCNLSAKMLLSEELEIGFLLLHSYDYFELFYKLYCHYFKTNKIDNAIYEKLLEKIK
jgi:hypothetical protein